MSRKCFPQWLKGSADPGGRRGAVLVVVLVVVVLLSLAAYAFTESMVVEMQAARLDAQKSRARAAALSGVEYAAAVVADPQLSPARLAHDPGLFQMQGVDAAGPEAGQPCFSIVVPAAGPHGDASLRFGLLDESGKLNLNQVLSQAADERYYSRASFAFGKRRDAVNPRERLLVLPGMTVELADAVLDWIDDDDQPRQFGAERSEYESLGVPYVPRNGPLESLEELQLVRGVTPQLLYGEDANRNGLLDTSEDDGASRLPPDDRNGQLDVGWSEFLTVVSRERSLRRDGSTRIDLNQEDLPALYDAIKAEFDADAARFVAAYRLFGPVTDAAATDTADDGTAGQASHVSPDRLATRSGGSGESRGGLEFANGGHYEIVAIYDLIDASVESWIEGRRQRLRSPWSADRLADDLPHLCEAFTTGSWPVSRGRISVLQARPEVLRSVPGVDDDLAGRIAQSATRILDAGPSTLSDPLYATTGWLVTDGLVDVATMRRLDRYLTARGGVLRADVYGYVRGAHQTVRLQAIIDATTPLPRLMQLTDLTPLGTHYAAPLLESLASEPAAW